MARAAIEVAALRASFGVIRCIFCDDALTQMGLVKASRHRNRVSLAKLQADDEIVCVEIIHVNSFSAGNTLLRAQRTPEFMTPFEKGRKTT